MNDDLLEGKVNGAGFIGPFAVSFQVWIGVET